ncbi:MAG: helix-turn-helix transcriptional regulator [Rubellimicrobium sp.]|nr:helix-turn-helix transcriptional regulator [Rubellimicrobium sp.]
MSALDDSAASPRQSDRRPVRSISLTVRTLRKTAGLTLADLAERCGLATSTLSKIENGQMSPTYDTILALSEGLGVDIADLVSGSVGKPVNGRRSIARRGESLTYQSEHYDYELLCADIANRRFVPLLVEIKSRSVHDFKGLTSHPGEEFVHVLNGRIEFHSEFYAPAELHPGDSCYFDSRMGHAFVNLGDEVAKVLLVCSRLTTAFIRP